MGHAGWPNGLRSGDGAFPRLRISEMRDALRRRLWKAQLFLLGSVSLFRLRATHLSRKLARYRSMLAFRTREAVLNWLARPHFAFRPAGSRFVLRDGSGLSGLRASLRLALLRRVLCHTHQSRRPVAKALLAGRRQDHRLALRSHRHAHLGSLDEKLSGPASPGPLLRPR